MEYRNKGGVLHRIGGPAYEEPDGAKEWYVNGIRHREDGPAIISKAGTKMWILNGKYHRINGPAVIWPDGSKDWYINGNVIPNDDIPETKEEWVIAILKYS